MRYLILTLVAIVFGLNLNAKTFDADSLTFKTLTSSTVAVTASTTFEYSGALTIPSTVTYDGLTYSVTEIDRLAFRNCVGLTEISLPTSVTAISQMAFDGCTSLSKITMPGVTSIRDAAFQNTAIAEITLPECLTQMFNAVFMDCKNLKKLQIPASLVYLGSNSPCIGCTSLTEINVSEENPKYKSINGVLYSKDGKTLIAYPCGLETVTITEGTEKIGYQSFMGNPHITSVLFPASVSSIERYAFKNCSSLIEFMVDADNIEYTAKDGLLYFGNVMKLCPPARTSAIVKENTKEIADQAFYECRNLTTVSLPTSLYEIGDQAFDYCTALESIELPQMVTVIGMNAFGDCTRLKSIVIPDKVTSLPNDLFVRCTSLERITLGAGITNIGNAVFSHCDNIHVINVKVSVPPEVNIDFRGFVPENVYSAALLNVPDGSISEYKNTTPWSNFTNIAEVDFAGIDGVNVDSNDDNYPMFDLNGRVVNNPHHGQILIQNGLKKIWNKFSH